MLIRFRFTGPQGELIKEISIKDCTPPPGRPSHELRCVLREAFPRALTAQLPPGTVHYGVTVIGASMTSSGVCHLLHLLHLPPDCYSLKGAPSPMKGLPGSKACIGIMHMKLILSAADQMSFHP